MSKDDSEDIYEDAGMEDALEEEEIDDLEEGFMRGYEEEGVLVCPVCKKVIDDLDEVVELEYEGESISLCSLKCEGRFRKKHNL